MPLMHATDDGAAGEQDRAALLQSASAILGVPIVRVLWRRESDTRAECTIVVDGGYRVRFESARLLLNQKEVRVRVFAECSRVVKCSSRGRWIEACRLLAEAAEDAPPARPGILGRLESYLEATSPATADWRDAAMAGRPFAHDGMLYVYLASLKADDVAHAREMQRMSEREVVGELRARGFTQLRISIRRQGKRTERSYWAAPIAALDLHLPGEWGGPNDPGSGSAVAG